MLDAGTFAEIGLHAQPHFSQRGMEGRDAPADGVITGYGLVDGRLVAVVRLDFTVMAGSMGMTGEIKVARLRELALDRGCPMVWLLDSAGARDPGGRRLAVRRHGHLFREQVGDERRRAAGGRGDGPVRGGTAYIPGLADFVPMVAGRGSMALAGPHLVRAAIGEDVTQEELGGARVHCRRLGCGDHETADDEECLARIREYLSYFPSHCGAPPPRRPVRDPVDRADEELLDVLPESNRAPYDMYEVIRRIVDDGELLDLKRAWARRIITCLARMGGRPVGIVANQPRHLGGVLDIDSADKAARFVTLCDAFGIPLVFLQDVPGFMVGHEGRGGGDHPPRREDAPRGRRGDGAEVTVVLRKAYGAGYYVMCGRASSRT